MADERRAREEVIELYGPEVDRLAAFIPWLTEKSGSVTQEYKPEGGKTIAFPVYDATLLRFVKEMDKSIFLDKNYPYVYSRNGIRSVADELSLIERTDIMNLKNIGGILSKYIIGGRTKGLVWAQGVENGIYLAGLSKAKDLIDFYKNDKNKA